MDLPNHFYTKPDDFEISADILIKGTKHLNWILSQFWDRWLREHLTELRDAHQYRQGVTRDNRISVGDVALKHNELQPRSFWTIVHIRELLTGHDGKITGASLQVTTKDKISTLRRLIQLLYPLEITFLYIVRLITSC